MKIALSVLVLLLIIGIFVVIVLDNGDSGRKMAWLLIITVLPVVGITLFFLFGMNFRHHWMFNRRYRRYKEYLEENITPELSDLLFDDHATGQVREEYRPLVELMQKVSRIPVTDGNDVEIITNGHRKFNALMKDIEQAETSIHIEYFHFGNDSGGKAIRDLLMKKAEEGVEVRFVHENIANLPILPGYYNQMKKSGVQVKKFSNQKNHILNFVTTLNYRNHRKIVVIDGKIAYTGGMNANNHYFLTWRDTHMRITGKAVASLQYVFLSTWLTCKGTLSSPLVSYFPQVSLSGTGAAALSLVPAPTPVADEAIARLTKGTLDIVGTKDTLAGRTDLNLRHEVLKNKLVQIVPDETDAVWPVIQMSYAWIIQHAKKYIWLQSPYFVPTETVLDALRTAALSGVDVRLMVPENVDTFFMGPANRSYFEECLEAGVKIYLRGGAFCHAKTFVCDDYISSIGSANLDFRSLELSHETNAYIFDEETALVAKAIYEKDMELCTRVCYESFSARPFHKRFAEHFIRLFAPLL